MKKDIILIGGGGHCKSCIDVIETENKFNIAGIVDLQEKIGEKVLGYEIITSDSELSKLAKEYKYFLITIGHIDTPFKRMEKYQLLKSLNVLFPIIVSPFSYISKHAKIGEGTIVMHNAQINVDCKIGCNCIINSKALLEHDVKVGDHCHVSTGAILNGGTKLGNCCFFGSNAVSKQYSDIPSETFIKANSIIK